MLRAIKQYRLIARARHRLQWVISKSIIIDAGGSEYSRMRTRIDLKLMLFGRVETLAQNASSYYQYFGPTCSVPYLIQAWGAP